MPRFFDDYSNTYLTHDSAAGRKQQRRGWKFRENFKLHYEAYLDEWRKGGMGLAAAQQGYIRARGKDDPMVPPLPDGWKEDVDECTGISYYYNDHTGKRTWVRPGFIPPPPGRGAPPPMRGGVGPPGSFRGGAGEGPPGPGGFPHRGGFGGGPPPFGNRMGGGVGPPPPPMLLSQPPAFPPPQQGHPPFPAGGPPPPPGGFGNIPPQHQQQGPPPGY